MNKFVAKYLWQFAMAVCIIIGSQGCTDSDSPLPGEDMQLVLEVENLSRSVVDLGYAKLNSRQKVLLWTRHLDSFQNKDGVSPELVQYVNDLKGILSVEYFDKVGKTESEEYFAKITEKWYTEPIRSGKFTADQLLDLTSVFRLGVEDSDAAARTSDISLPSKPKCACVYNMGCVNRCNIGNCASGDNSCGFWGNTACSGRCG